MKPILVLAGSLTLSACAGDTTQVQLDDIRDARGDLPGIETEINCNRAPRIIFDKQGEIVETIQPVRHPSCPETDVRNMGLIRQGNMYVAANSGPSPFNEASDDDIVVVARSGENPENDPTTGTPSTVTPTTGTPTTGTPTPETPTKGTPTQPPVAVIPCASLECEPTDAKEWVAWRRHFGIATTKQDIVDHVEKFGGTW